MLYILYKVILINLPFNFLNLRRSATGLMHPVVPVVYERSLALLLFFGSKSIQLMLSDAHRIEELNPLALGVDRLECAAREDNHVRHETGLAGAFHSEDLNRL